MSIKSYTGISFPFRVGVKGGVVMSSTDTNEVPHIIEAMQQIVSTHPYERCMEFDFKTDVINNVFGISNDGLYLLIAYQVQEALQKLEDRIEILGINVDKQGTDESTIIAEVTFRVNVYNEIYTTQLKVGDVSGKNNN